MSRLKFDMGRNQARLVDHHIGPGMEEERSKRFLTA